MKKEKDKGLFMRRLAIITFWITIFVIVASIVLVLFGMKGDCTDQIKVICRWLLVSLVAWYVVCLLTYVVSIIGEGIRNLRDSGDELFKNIDYFQRCWGESDAYYIRQVQIINWFYNESRMIDILVENGEYKRLLDRRDFLSKNVTFWNDFLLYLSSAVMAVLTSFMLDVINGGELGYGVIAIFVGTGFFCVFFIAFLMWKYSKRGEDGSYLSQIREYELKLLDKKINDLNQRLQISESEKNLLTAQQEVVRKLIEKTKKGRRKERKRIENESEKICRLNLVHPSIDESVQAESLEYMIGIIQEEMLECPSAKECMESHLKSLSKKSEENQLSI